MSRGTLVGLGEAYELGFRRFSSAGGDGLGKLETYRFPNHWWAWDGSADTGSIRLVKFLGRARSRRTSETAEAMHIQFHGQEPGELVMVEDYKPGRPLRVVGRVVSFAYDARALDSTKSDRPYRHHFGAFTHADKPPFPSDALPDLVMDGQGHLFIQRRHGNTFRLADWVIG